MTRCIHCTRCIRFADRGRRRRGAGRDRPRRGHGDHDLCRAGARLRAVRQHHRSLPGRRADLQALRLQRPAVGAAQDRDRSTCWTRSAATSASTRAAREVMRVLPRLNEDVNEEWISDKTRFAVDGLRRQRLDRPYVRARRQAASGDLGRGLRRHRRPARRRSPATEIAAIAGDLVRCRGDVRAEGPDDGARLAQPRLPPGRRQARGRRRAAAISSTPTIAGIEQADACLLIGTNPRWEAPLLNARIRKRYLHGGIARSARSARAVDLTYPVERLGAGPATLRDLADGKPRFAETLKAAKNPMLILGQGALARADGAAVLGAGPRARRKLRRWCATAGTASTSCIPRRRASAGSISASCRARAAATSPASSPAARSGEIDVVYLLGADEIDTQRLGKAFVIYQGHHGDAGAHRADVILPGAAYTEKDAHLRQHRGPGAARPARRLPAGRGARGLGDPARAVGASGQDRCPTTRWARCARGWSRRTRASPRSTSRQPARLGRASARRAGRSDAPFASPIANFYLTDPISRASETMADCMASRTQLMAAE